MSGEKFARVEHTTDHSEVVVGSFIIRKCESFEAARDLADHLNAAHESAFDAWREGNQ